jgi:hypothetical protein
MFFALLVPDGTVVEPRVVIAPSGRRIDRKILLGLHTEKARGQRQTSFHRIFNGCEPVMKGVMIHADSGGYQTLASIRLS